LYLLFVPIVFSHKNAINEYETIEKRTPNEGIKKTEFVIVIKTSVNLNKGNSSSEIFSLDFNIINENKILTYITDMLVRKSFVKEYLSPISVSV